ncbi:MAG: hypothetical protein V8R08_04280 [Coriobacteriales bacterium]
MPSTDDVHKLHVYVRNSKGELKRFGRVRATVFHPDEPRVVGLVIKRPDALLMVKRKERFAAIDRIEPVEGGISVIDASDSWDAEACKRLGVDYDRCIIWEYMPVRTESGQDIGLVGNVTFDADDFTIEHIDISTNSANRVLLGSSLIPREKIIGYRDGAIVVADEEADVEETGGAAAKAGVAWAKTKHAASEGTKKAGEAINEGAYKAGEVIGSVRDKASKAAEEHEAKKREAAERGEYVGVDKAANLLGKQLGRASGMFKGFKEEFDKASHDD